MKSVPVTAVSQSTVSKSDTSTPDDDFVTAEVLFSEVRPQTGHFEVIPSDSDEPTSSESGTPVPHRIRLVRDDLQAAGTASAPGARAGSRSPMKVVEVCDVKSSEASQWRKEAMEGLFRTVLFVILFCYFYHPRRMRHGNIFNCV